MAWGYLTLDVQMENWLNDSQQGSIIGNWCNVYMANATVKQCTTSGNANLVTGNAIFSLRPEGNITPTVGTTAGVGQNINLVMAVLGASFTTTGTTSDTVTITGMFPTSQVLIQPTNNAAMADWVAGNVKMGTKSFNQVVINHSNTSGMTFDVIATGGF
jgi:hypothetical protein